MRCDNVEVIKWAASGAGRLIELDESIKAGETAVAILTLQCPAHVRKDINNGGKFQMLVTIDDYVKESIEEVQTGQKSCFNNIDSFILCALPTDELNTRTADYL